MAFSPKELASRIAAVFRRRTLDDDFCEELESHLALIEDEELRRGMDPQQARREARMKLGNTVNLSEAHREARGLPFLDTLQRDTRLAIRSLNKSRGFTSAAMLTLALGIGANTAIFSTVDQALFRPLDFPQPDQLADVFSFNISTQTFLSSSWPDFEDYRTRSRAFRQFAAFVRMPMMVASRGQRDIAERLPVEAVSGNFFAMLELPPAAGRAFTDLDDSSARPRVAMLSEDISNPRSLGKTVFIEDQPFTVIGLIPKRYRGTNLNWGEPPKVWIPLHSIETVQPGLATLDIFHKRAMPWLLLTGRLNPGFNAARAQAEIQTIAAGIALSAPTTNRNVTAMVYPASRSKFWPSYRDSITRSLMVFAAAAALVLLLTCANLSSLLMSRALTRRREFAIRLSLGASRGRVVRQLLTECLLLAVPSCVAALAVAYALGRILARSPNAFGLPLALETAPDYRVLCFCMTLSLATTILFGLLPALQATRPDVLPALKESANAVTGGTADWLRNTLLVMQLAFTMILLTGGGLFSRSVLKAWSLDLGFHADDLLTAVFNPPRLSPASAARINRDQAKLVERLKSMPGVRSAALSFSRPLGPIGLKMQVQSGSVTALAIRQAVGPGYFETMSIALHAGHDIDPATAGGQKSVVVNEALAAKVWPGENPLGRTLAVQKETMIVVGMAGDSRINSVWDEQAPTFYTTPPQTGPPANCLIVRTGGNSDALASAIAGEWNRIQPRLPLYDFRSGADLVNFALAPQRMAAGIFAAFGGLAAVLACVGLYSSVAHRVASRTREIGIRLAVGASPSAVIWQILKQSLTLVGIGVAAGAAACMLLTRFIESLVKGISVHDSGTFVGVAAMLGLVAFVATTIPARRAGRISPQLALRSE